jgi:hypothetical protein
VCLDELLDQAADGVRRELEPGGELTDPGRLALAQRQQRLELRVPIQNSACRAICGFVGETRSGTLLLPRSSGDRRSLVR